jgi:glycosyltransferase involved in cell wall biosynthesis
MMPRLSIVTTCKGRLAHLRQSLPSYLAQPGAEVIVVDYDCPDGTAAFVEKEYPAARVAKVRDRPHFNVSHARNSGAALATAEWIAFVDADIVLTPNFLDGNAANIAEPDAFFHYLKTDKITGSAFGTNLVRRADFTAIGGYDEVMDGYGGEDQDFYFRLVLLGLARKPLDHALIAKIITHDDAERVRFNPHGSFARNSRINTAYMLVKDSLLRQLGLDALTEEKCRQIHGLVRAVVADANRSPDAPIHFTLELPPDPHFMPAGAWDCRRHLVFDLTPNLHPDADQRRD